MQILLPKLSKEKNTKRTFNSHNFLVNVVPLICFLLRFYRSQTPLRLIRSVEFLKFEK